MPVRVMAFIGMQPNIDGSATPTHRTEANDGSCAHHGRLGVGQAATGWPSAVGFW